MKGVEQEIERAYANELTIITSVLTLNEVLQSQMTMEQKDRYQKIFHHASLQLVDIDRRIAADAATIRGYYDKRVFDKSGRRVSGNVMVAMGDAFHLATALHYEVTEFKTLDGAGRHKRHYDLLALNGNVAGRRLSIVPPKYIPPPEPLAGPVSPVSGEQTNLFENTAKDEDGKTEETQPTPAELSGSGGGHLEGQAGTEVSEEKSRSKEAGKE